MSEIRRLAYELGRITTATVVRDHGRFFTYPYGTRFGTWDKALEAAGFNPTHRYPTSDEPLLEEIVRLTHELGRVPNTTDMVDKGLY